MVATADSISDPGLALEEQTLAVATEGEEEETLMAEIVVAAVAMAAAAEAVALSREGRSAARRPPSSSECCSVRTRLHGEVAPWGIDTPSSS